jgi:hypothetical protein
LNTPIIARVSKDASFAQEGASAWPGRRWSREDIPDRSVHHAWEHWRNRGSDGQRGRAIDTVIDEVPEKLTFQDRKRFVCIGSY